MSTPNYTLKFKDTSKEKEHILAFLNKYWDISLKPIVDTTHQEVRKHYRGTNYGELTYGRTPFEVGIAAGAEKGLSPLEMVVDAVLEHGVLKGVHNNLGYGSLWYHLLKQRKNFLKETEKQFKKKKIEMPEELRRLSPYHSLPTISKNQRRKDDLAITRYLQNQLGFTAQPKGWAEYQQEHDECSIDFEKEALPYRGKDALDQPEFGDALSNAGVLWSQIKYDFSPKRSLVVAILGQGSMFSFKAIDNFYK